MSSQESRCGLFLVSAGPRLSPKQQTPPAFSKPRPSSSSYPGRLLRLQVTSSAQASRVCYEGRRQPAQAWAAVAPYRPQAASSAPGSLRAPGNPGPRLWWLSQFQAPKEPVNAGPQLTRSLAGSNTPRWLLQPQVASSAPGSH